MKSEQLLHYIGEIEPKYVEDAECKAGTVSRKSNINSFRIMRLAPIAACLAVVIVLAAIFGKDAGWFGSKVYAVELGGGTLSFYKSEAVSAGDLGFGVETSGRNLTSTENGLLFGDIGVTSYGLFSTVDQTLLHVEGRAGNAKIVLAAHGTPVTDTMIETIRKTSELNGIPVSAGYWITDKNSKGEQNIIFLASYEQDGVTMYVENYGTLGEDDKVKTDIANVIDTLTQNGMSYLPGIYFETNIENQSALYIAGNSWVSLAEGNKYYLCGPMAVSFTPSGTYTIEGDVLTLFDGINEAFKFTIQGDSLVFESGEWLENWVEPGTIFMLAEPESLYSTKNAQVMLIEGNKYYLYGPAAVSFTPSGRYTIEGDVLTLYDGSEETVKFSIRNKALVFESGEWMENWVEPGTVFMLAERD